MSKKSFIIILVLSVVVTYGVTLIDALRRNSLFGEGGVPLKFTSGSAFLGESSTEFLPLILDIFFWFIILFGIWSLIKKVTSK